MAYLILFDADFNPLGSPASGDVSTVHVCKSWSLKRKAFEFDEFTAVCRGYEDSKDAVYVGLFDNTGKLIYRCFSGIPTTSGGLTTVNGVDVRKIFDQDIPLDYSKAIDSNGFTSENAIYNLLLKDSLDGITEAVSLTGIEYSVNTIDTSHEKVDNGDGSIVSGTKEIRNIWEQIQACNAIYSNMVLAEWKNDAETNAFKLTFKVCPIFNVYAIRRKDFGVKRTMEQNAVNHASVWTNDLSAKLGEYFLLKDPIVDKEEQDGQTRYKLTYIADKFSNNVAIPLHSKAIAMDKVTETSESETNQVKAEDEYAENLKKAREEAIQTLMGSIAKDRVTIDLNSRYGSRISGIELSDMGQLSGYYSADGEGGEDKFLPVSAIMTDSKGTHKVEFGRLSEYWFLD